MGSNVQAPLPYFAETTDFKSLPVIDLARLRSPDAADRLALAMEMRDACSTCGFFYIKNHGVPEEVIQAAFARGKEFFALPLEKKMIIDKAKSTSFRGYAPLKVGKVNAASTGDVHEAFDMGRSDMAFSDDGTGTSANQFPSEEIAPGFEKAIMDAWDHIMALGKSLFPLFALALGLEEDYFEKHLKHPGAMMRVLHYPPQRGEYDPKEIGIGAHTDYEMFTLLAQDDITALQVLNGAGEWINAPPIPGTFVLNLGEQLQRWTNDYFKSTVHRAINRTGVDRMSLPLFFGVDYETLIKPMDNCVTKENPAKYEPIGAGQLVEELLEKTYGKPTAVPVAVTA